MTNPVAKTPSDIVNSANTIFVIIYFMEGFVMCVESTKQCVPDSELRKALINSIIKLSKDKQKIVIEEAKRLGFFVR